MRVVVVLYLYLQLYKCGGEYVWENTKWVWKDDSAGPEPAVEAGEEEGSGVDYDDEPDDGWEDGSGDDPDDDKGYDWSEPDNKNNNNNKWGVDSPENKPAQKNDDIEFNEETTTTTTTTTLSTTSTTKVASTTKGSVENSNLHSTSFFAQPGILAAVIGGAVVGLLCAILLVMFIVYRMRKKDEGSYALDEPRRSPNVHLYSKAPTREFFA